MRSFSAEHASSRSEGDRYSVPVQRVALEIGRERFRRERERAGEDVPTPVLAKAFLELRRALATGSPSMEGGASQDVPALTELLRDRPDVRRAFSVLVEALVRGQAPDAQGRVLPLDTGDPAWRRRSEAWIAALLDVAADATPAQRAEIRRSAEGYLQAYASVIYARAVERFVVATVKSHQPDLQDAWRRQGALEGIEAAVRRRFAFSPTEARHLVAMHLPTERSSEAFIEKMAYLREIWEKNAKQIPRRAIIESAALTVISGVVRANLPRREEASFQGDQFSLEAYVAYLVGEVAADLLRNVEDNASKNIRRQWDREIAWRRHNSRLFRRGQHSDQQDPERADEAVTEGAEALDDLRHMVLDRIGPTIVGLCTTLAAMARIHPIAALAGAGSLPLLAYAEHVRLTSQQREKKKEKVMREALRDRFRIYEHAPEDVQLTPEAERLLGVFDALERHANQVIPHGSLLRRKLVHTTTKYLGALVSGVATHLVQGVADVRGEPVREVLKHLRELDSQMRAVIAETSEKFGDRVEQIQAMEKILGPQEEYDTPGGLRERARLPVSKLPSYEVSLDGLWYGVLKGVSLTIREGEMVHLVGDSGSGKSTILKQIVGTLAPAHGEVRIGGLPHHAIRRYGEDSLYEILAYAEQHPKINQKASIRDNLLAFTPSLHVGDAEIRALLISLGLSPLAADLDRPIGHPLSGGELTRFSLAKALIRRPKILLLDEPTGPLDQKTARGIWQLIDDLHAAYPRLTMIIVTHDPVRLERVERAGGARSRILQMQDLHAQSDAAQRKRPHSPNPQT